VSQDYWVIVEHVRGEVSDISYAMLAAARDAAGASGGATVALLLGHGSAKLAADLPADRVLVAEKAAPAEFVPDAYILALARLIPEHGPRAVLFGDTTIGADVATALSARLGLPLVSHCRRLEVQDGAPAYSSQICGGKIMAEGPLPEPTALVMMIPGGHKPDAGGKAAAPEVISVTVPDPGGMRVTFKRYIEPDAGDVDIAQSAVLVGVGRGIQQQDNVELAEELAAALGGAVCASRPIVDQGWLPASRLVGKSGKSVRPKLYIALGISGAPEHVEGITASDHIVAVNTDPAAPIFEFAQYGTDLDMFDLLPVLTDLVREARG
jgi:electron transfer flavoprotein alpha subunit